jgi:tetratricopeptide (TPR) repeat protein
VTAVPRPDPLTAAVLAREEGRDEEARQMLLELHRQSPDDALVNLQCAWVHDKLGLEAEAVPFYEKALEAGLEGNDLQDALLGLGSTYRALGRYDESLLTLDRGVASFPDDAAMKVFRAMTLYNQDRGKEACELLLNVLASTNQPDPIARYRTAIAEYALDLDRTWR